MEGYKAPQEDRDKKKFGNGLGYAAALAAGALGGGPVDKDLHTTYPTIEVSTTSNEVDPVTLHEHERREIDEIERYLSKSAREEIATIEAVLDVPDIDYEKERRMDDMTRKLVMETDPEHLILKSQLRAEEYEAKKAETHEIENPSFSGDEDDPNRLAAALRAAKS